VVGTLVDSLCWSSGTNGYAAWVTTVGPATQTAFLLNDTLVATGSGGQGLEVAATGGFTATANITNTIARGTAADVWIGAGPHSPTTATLCANYSNFATVVHENGGGIENVDPQPGCGSNQTAAPAFVDAADGNFRELASSPTVKAGVPQAMAPVTDLAGNPREVGTYTDIGAYQFIPAPSCSNLMAATNFATPTVIQLSCQDVLSTPVTYAIASQPAHGLLALNATTGAATYTPTSGFSGRDSFTYTATNAHGTATNSTVMITVGPEPKPGLSQVSAHNGKLWFQLTEPATVKFRFTQTKHGHTKVRGTLTVAGTMGHNMVPFHGRLSDGHVLPAGKYKVFATASNAGGQSAPVSFAYKQA
jgi:hypothetical protein